MGMKKQTFGLFFLMSLILLFLNPVYALNKVPDFGKKILPGVVLVTSYDGEKYTMGSGFFVTSKGDVLTNYNLIKGKQYIIISILHNKNSETYLAKLRGYDESRDLALLMTGTPKEKFKSLTIAKQHPKKGTPILVVGAPNAVKESNLGSEFVSPGGNLSFPKINTSIDWADIGAPVLDMKGSVVGLATKRELQQGGIVDLAVPSPLLLSFVNYAKELPPVDIFPEKKNEQSTEKPSNTEITRNTQKKNYGRFIPVFSSDSYGSVYLDRNSFSSYNGVCTVLIQIIPSTSMRRQLKLDSDMSFLLVQYDVDIDYNHPRLRQVQGVGVFTNGETIAINDIDTRWTSGNNNSMFRKIIDICRDL